jgi:hypothetical protein
MATPSRRRRWRAPAHQIGETGEGAEQPGRLIGENWIRGGGDELVLPQGDVASGELLDLRRLGHGRDYIFAGAA